MLSSLAWSLLAYGVVVWLTILVNKVFGVHLPRPYVWLFTGLGVSVAAAGLLEPVPLVGLEVTEVFGGVGHGGVEFRG